MMVSFAERYPIKRKLFVTTCCLLCTILHGPRASAQVLYGSIVGSVTDSSRAVIPRATVRITQLATGQSRTTTTDDSGVFGFPTVGPGTYNVTVSKEGFQRFATEGLTVPVDQVARIDAILPIGNVSETVQVSGQAVQLQTESAEVRDEIVTRQLQDIPVPVNRNYESLLVTVPGFSPPDNSNSIPANPARGMTMEANGAIRGSNNFRIDGATSQNVWLADLVAYIPGLEAIETVSVVTNSFDQSQGLAGGAVVNVRVNSHEPTARFGVRIQPQQRDDRKQLFRTGRPAQSQVH
jgi:hypothetical protein